MPPYRSMTGEAHALLARHLRPGQRVFDGTAGNGHDSLALAHLVAPGGSLWAVDVQEEAVESTRRLLAEAELSVQTDIRCGSHGELEGIFPAWGVLHFDAAIFNLGYLPGGDHTLTTTAETTLRALGTIWERLTPGGLLVVVCYPGHHAGQSESVAVEAWFAMRAQRDGASVESRRVEGTRRAAPFVLAATKAPAYA